MKPFTKNIIIKLHVACRKASPYLCKCLIRRIEISGFLRKGFSRGVSYLCICSVFICTCKVYICVHLQVVFIMSKMSDHVKFPLKIRLIIIIISRV